MAARTTLGHAIGGLSLLFALGCEPSDQAPALDAGDAWADAQLTDAELNTPAITGLRFRPARPVVVEGAAPTPLTLVAEGPAGACREVALSGLSVNPSSGKICVGAPLALTISAPQDADERDGLGVVEATTAERSASVTAKLIDGQTTLTLALTPEQRAFIDSSADKEVRLTVATRLSGAPAPFAEINLRGKGTLACARRSLTMRFAEPVVVGDSPPLEDVYLLSMCLDLNYLKMRTSAELLTRQGLFLPWYRLVELNFGDDTQGAYLLVERPRDAIARHFPENQRVIRRLSDRTEEVKRPDPEDVADLEALLAPYRALYQLGSLYQGEALVEALSATMDLRGYLRWLAINSVLENGDYIDEVYFYDHRSPTGAEPYFSVMGWDYDDIQKNCHTPRPIDEPLFYCAESSLDRLVPQEEAVRAVYRAVLAELLGTLDEAAFNGAVDRAKDALAMYLARPGVAEVMTREGVLPDPAVSAAEMKARFKARRDALLTLLEAP